MKIVKGISLFLLYPVMMLVIGFYAGVEMTHYFYPGDRPREGTARVQEEGNGTELFSDRQTGGTDTGMHGAGGAGLQDGDGTISSDMPVQEGNDHPSGQTDVDRSMAGETGADGLEDVRIPEDASQEGLLEAASNSERLYVDTEYVLEETDIDDQTVVETSGRLPQKYIGMNREQFLAAMENYAAAPPLTEMERGFVGLEVLSFSRERVVVQMNYSYVKPSTSYYLAVYDNQVLVYLDDRETVYIETDIQLDSLPADVQQEIMQMKWIENEETLFNFLESYSS